MTTTIQIAQIKESEGKNFTTPKSDKISIPKDTCSFPISPFIPRRISDIYSAASDAYSKVLRKDE